MKKSKFMEGQIAFALQPSQQCLGVRDPSYVDMLENHRELESG